MENKKLMAMARESLSGKWGLAVGTFLVFWLIMAAAKSNGIAVLLIGGPMLIGLAIFSLTIARNQDAKLEQIFEGFKKNLGTALVAYLLKAIFVFLWTYQFGIYREKLFSIQGHALLLFTVLLLIMLNLNNR